MNDNAARRRYERGPRPYLAQSQALADVLTRNGWVKEDGPDAPNVAGVLIDGKFVPMQTVKYRGPESPGGD